MDEKHFEEIETTMLYIEDARARAERAIKALRADRAEAHLVEALERVERELSDAHRRLRQDTHFAVPSAQTSL